MPVMFKAIKPPPFHKNVFEEELRRHAEPVVEGIHGDYLEGVKDWNHEVHFDTNLEVDGNGVRISVDTTDEIYFYNHEGTEGHEIRAVNAPNLAFLSGFKPKTQPGRISSSAGGSFGDLVLVPSVEHPGNEGRKQTKPIKAKWRPYFNRQMTRALRKAAARSGHGR